jgi:hypothetical protein
MRVYVVDVQLPGFIRYAVYVEAWSYVEARRIAHQRYPDAEWMS